MIKQIENLPNYLISDDGKFYNKSYKELFQRPNRDGYMVSYRSENNKQKTVSIHREVAKAFIPNPENKPCVNHIDGDKKNNHVSNLEWVTYSENNKHAFKIGLSSVRLGENSPLSKYTDDEIHIVCKMMQDGYRKKEVISSTGISESTYKNINTRRCWNHISDLYEFSGRNNNISEVSVRWVCQMIVQGYKNCQIIKMANSKKITAHVVSSIRNRKSFQSIVSQYNF